MSAEQQTAAAASEGAAHSERARQTPHRRSRHQIMRVSQNRMHMRKPASSPLFINRSARCWLVLGLRQMRTAAARGRGGKVRARTKTVRSPPPVSRVYSLSQCTAFLCNSAARCPPFIVPALLLLLLRAAVLCLVSNLVRSSKKATGPKPPCSSRRSSRHLPASKAQCGTHSQLCCDRPLAPSVPRRPLACALAPLPSPLVAPLWLLRPSNSQPPRCNNSTARAAALRTTDARGANSNHHER